MNIRISAEECYKLFETGNVVPIGPSDFILLGRRLMVDEHGAILYEACEYCGKKEIGKRSDCAVCGAPLSNQGFAKVDSNDPVLRIINMWIRAGQ